jgi:hypothetical protein
MPKLTTTEIMELTESEFNDSEITNLRIIIYEYSKAIRALVSGKHASYELNTGQTSQRVTRLDLDSLISTRKLLLEELQTRESAAGLNRSVVTVQPDW